MTKAQDVFERVEALVKGGSTKADAFRQVADEFGQPANSIRGAYYTHTRTLGGTPSSARRRPAATADPVEEARNLLSAAISAIDAEVAGAKDRIDEAKAIYDELKATAGERKAALEAKLDALSAA